MMSNHDPAPGLQNRRKLLVMTVIVLVVFAIALWLGADHLGAKPFSSFTRTIAAFVTALAVLVGTGMVIFNQGNEKTDIPYVIAFDIIAFVVLGLAVLISAATRWQAACLMAGASLLGGGFFGFIFGMPLSAVSAPDQGEAGQTAAKAAEEAHNAMMTAFAARTDEAIAAAKQAQATAQKAAETTGRIAKHSLLAEAAGTLSKLIAGATLVQIKPLFEEFKRASEYISIYLLQDNPLNGATLGGAALLYFIFLGFLSGLFLPAYFMQDFWDRS